MNKSIRLYAILLLSALTMIGCGKSKTKLQKEISDLESMPNATPEDKARIVGFYLEYANEYPTDSVSKEYLITATIYNYATGKNDVAIALGNQFLNTYDSCSQTQTAAVAIAKSYHKKGASDSTISFYNKALHMGQIDDSDLFKLLNAYTNVGAGNDDKKGPSALMKAADITYYLIGPDSAAPIYKQLWMRFGKSPLAPAAMFRQAQMEEESKHIDDAVATLNELIKTHPKSNFAKDAQIMISKDLIGKTDEEKLEIITKGLN
ncbi:MAG: tetratricopeptide (TPR) repeat protein [Bacteroidia bacterium]|jgi:tetratricopeptide (TPR) repeat protein